MKIVIDTTLRTCTFQEECENVIRETNCASKLADHLGTKEYDGIVAEIQKWYYGRLVKAAWCATCVSYFCYKYAKQGSFMQTHKYESCTAMRAALIKNNLYDSTKHYGGGNYKAKIGDIVFISWKNNPNSPDHVGFVHDIDHTTGELLVISGNSSDMIKVDAYNYLNDKRIIGFGRVEYG